MSALRRNRDFLFLCAGQCVSLLGDRLHYLALVALLASTQGGLTGPLASMRLSVVALTTTLPVILFAGLAGSLVDRWPKRTVLIVCDSLRAGLVLLVPLTQTLGGGLPAALCVIFVLYTINVFFLPARAAILPELVPTEHLTHANAATTSGNIVATILGTAAGGAIIQAAGFAWGFYLDAVSYGLSVCAMSAMRARPAPARVTRRATHVMADIAEGVRTLRTRRGARVAVALFAVLYVIGASLFVLAPPAVARITDAPTRATGFLIAALAGGAIVGAACLARFGHVRSEWRTCAFGLALSGAAIAALALVQSISALAIAAVAAGLGAAPLLVGSDTILQRDVPADVRARVFAARDVIVKSAFLLAAAGVGVLAVRVSAASILLVEGCVVVAAGVALWLLARAHLAPAGGETVDAAVAGHVPHVDEGAPHGAVVGVQGLDEVVEVALRDRVR